MNDEEVQNNARKKKLERKTKEKRKLKLGTYSYFVK